MKQPEDQVTIDWVGDLGPKPATGGGMADRMPNGQRPCHLCHVELKRETCAHECNPPTDRTKRRGAYAGAVKIGARGHQLRAATGKSQAEFAQLAGVSERSLRTWEGAADPVRECPKVHGAICDALAKLGHAWGPLHCRVRYRCPDTGMTWSGRGLMPRWVSAALERGRTLAELRAAAALPARR